MNKLLASVALLLMVFAPLAIADEGNKTAAKQDLQDARTSWQQSKDDFQTAKQALEDARKARGNQTKNQTRDELLDLRKALLIRLVDRVKSHIDVAEAWANAIKIDDSTRASIISSLEDLKTRLESEKTAINAATTLAALKTEAEKIRTMIHDTQHAIKIAVAQLLGNRTENLVNRAQNLSDRLDAKIAQLKGNNTNTSNVDSLVADFRAKIASAKSLADQADAKFRQAITDTANADQLVKDGRDLLKQSHQALKDAREDLKNIVRELRSLNVKPEDVGEKGEE